MFERSKIDSWKRLSVKVLGLMWVPLFIVGLYALMYEALIYGGLDMEDVIDAAAYYVNALLPDMHQSG